jgi:hypothetical protein
MSDVTRPTGGGGAWRAAGRSPDPAFAGRVPEGALVQANANHAAIHSLRLAPTRSMKAIAGEVEALLDGLEESSRRSAALLASELIAQVSGRAPGFNGEPVGLTVQVREDAVRLEATGPVSPSVRTTAGHDAVLADPLADWGRFIIDGLADRWGVENGGRPSIWAEIEAPA